MAVIEAKNIKKSYGKNETKFDALKGVDLKVEKGESVAIIGKSGSGKSTFMHILALLDQPTSGDIYLNGKNVTSIRKKVLNKTRNEEFGFVLSGTILLHLGKKKFKVKKGESFYFKPRSNHYISNGGKTQAKVIWISTPPSF